MDYSVYVGCSLLFLKLRFKYYLMWMLDLISKILESGRVGGANAVTTHQLRSSHHMLSFALLATLASAKF